ncbi:alpha/beta fold hydrolase [Mesorhizobium camelthorni]|uniref:Alpha/beta fold hydrolase n=2 Tax=Allomesorhizobium camelthorni TaxID=475069 RepID=A0A6G4WL95_9HYPH|nr:alpha/beta fold hydrolase [Mesorhizobium camelthorni]
MPSWLTHLEYQWRSVAWQPWLEALSSHYTLIRYDPRGCGLSDRNVADLSFGSWVRDFGVLADALALDRFSLIGICQGGAVAIAYAGKEPDRISHLVLYGTYARGRNKRSTIPLEPEKARVMLEMLRLGWGQEDHAFMRSFATQFQPEGSIEHLRSWCELQNAATSAENAVELTRVMFDVDVQEVAARISCPTLVAHPDRDAVAPFEEGRLLAQIIPNARFLPLGSPNHFMLRDESAWKILVEELYGFLPQHKAAPGPFADLTAREKEVLDLLARGLDNRQIGAQLDISEKTVRNHVSGIFAKLGVETRARAVAVARDAGYGC